MSLRTAEARMHGGRVRWREAGAGDAVIVIPGLGLTGKFYERNADAFAAAGYRFIVPDLPGLGGTTGSRTGIAVADITAFTRAFLNLLDLEHVALVGHSLGAQAALCTAAAEQTRVRALALVGPTGADRPRASRLRHQLAGLAREAWQAPWPVIGAVARDYVHVSPIAYVGTWLRCARDAPAVCAAQVRCPALFLVGTRDRVAERGFVAALATRIADARIAWLEGGGHALPRDCAPDFNAAALAFLREHI